MDFSVQFAESNEEYAATLKTSEQRFTAGFGEEESWAMQFKEERPVFQIGIAESRDSFPIQLQEGINTGHLPLYNGEYEVTPKTTEQTLKTAKRSMADDVTVHAIPYYEVDNAYQGQTVIIGGS